jgi:small-conductance mechanosensitive channel
MRADNTHHLIDASSARRHNTWARANDALRRLTDTGGPISVARLATEARVSRSWIYAQPELRARIEQAQASASTATDAPEFLPDERHGASPASLLRRLELAHQRIQQLTDDNRRLRDQLAHAYGQQRQQRHTGTGRPPARSIPDGIGPCS